MPVTGLGLPQKDSYPTERCGVRSATVGGGGEGWSGWERLEAGTPARTLLQEFRQKAVGGLNLGRASGEGNGCEKPIECPVDWAW